MDITSDQSDSETSVTSLEVEASSSEEEEAYVVNSQYTPYQDEPLADDEEEEENGGEDDDERDMDGLTPDILAARQDGTVPVNSWCQCEHCRNENLEGALEHRCCKEVNQASGMMVFDGSIEHIKCITEHEDYKAVSNKAVLLNVAPLLKNKNGRSYRRRAGASENEFVRAVAYRWIIRWLCGYMGWENTRPLPACIYHDIRTRYQTRHLQPRGYRQE